VKIFHHSPQNVPAAPVSEGFEQLKMQKARSEGGNTADFLGIIYG
jgi:hypothetical protein